MTEKVIPLLCCPSPRDIPEIQEAWEKIPYDRLEAKYFREKTAYKMLRKWFLRNKKYTHMVICPDDLIITPEQFETLKKDVEKYKMPIISGVCNVDLDDNKDFLNVTENLPHPRHPDHFPRNDGEGFPTAWRWYAWIHKSRIKKDAIMQFPFIGFTCQFIHRDIVEKLEFIDDAKENDLDETVYSSGVDVMYANQCSMAKIPLYADTRVRMVHMRHKGKVEITIGRGELRLAKHGEKTIVLVRGPPVEKLHTEAKKLKKFIEEDK